MNLDFCRTVKGKMRTSRSFKRTMFQVRPDFNSMRIIVAVSFEIIILIPVTLL